MKKATAIIIVVLALAAGGWAYHRYHQPQAENSRLFVSGTIEATEVEASFNLAGIVASVEVEEGDKVKAGQVLARLDDRKLQASLNEAKAAVATARARLPLLEATIRQTDAATAAGLDQAHNQVLVAQARLEQAEAALARATVEKDRAAKEWRRIELLFRQNAVTASQRDDAQAALAASESATREAKAAQEAAQAALKQALAAQAQAQAERLGLERLHKEIALAQAQVAQAEAQIGVLDETLRETVITAPISGVVISRNIEPGEVVSPGSSVVTLADLDHVHLRAYIPETALGRVKLGQAVSVTTDTFPEKTYLGRVAFISDQAEFTPKSVQTKEERVKLVFRIKVALENPDQELKPGLPAEGYIETEKQ